ncbi:serine hydrolase domain-containing protein [Arvimicrobium flavum]|uniref:serine hydrolase domain-containing protein n=1 Tax=Arvimicrobium flavum TaxID=3393320 RepID=UPI00237AD3B7|nr:serine hydrolase [Mesorhizobium shangrilense]
MRIVSKFVKGLALAVAIAAVVLGGWLYLAPPELIRVGSAYSAKIVCSNVFLAGRDPQQVLADDVQAPGHPLLRIMRVDVDDEARTVTAGLLGIFGTSVAVARDGRGCTSVPDGRAEAVEAVATVAAEPPADPGAPWPEGENVDAPNDAAIAAIAAILEDPELAGPGMRAVLVAHNGRIVGERYGEGFSPATPLLGWSMTKTVTAAIIGTLVKDGRMKIDESGLLDTWQGDGRKAISTADLMAMSSGLEFNEDYGDVTDVTRMLFLEPDMAAFAASKPLAGEVGKMWSYSSGTSLILSRIWQHAAGADAPGWPQKALFGPLGMRSAVLEADEAGTFVGSSYLYATARDWARFAQFLLQDGVWNGQRILPAGFVAWMREAAPASDGVYGRGQLWLRGPGPKDDPANAALPDDTYWLRGHDGQTIAIIPSRKLIVLRMGLTPSKLNYRPQALVAAVASRLAD